MSAAVSKRPEKTGSGEHPAVKTYREKLESISESTGAEVDSVTRKLDDYLESARTPVPPAP